MITSINDLPFAPEANRDIVRRLKQVDERLGLRYLPIGAGCWAITEKWGENDMRREFIKTGGMPANMDFDVLGFAPPDMTSDDAFASLTKSLRQKVTEKPEYAAMLNDTIYYNKARTEAVKAEARSWGDELIDANRDGINGSLTSRGAGFNIEDGKVVGTPVTAKRGLTNSEREARVEMSDK